MAYFQGNFYESAARTATPTPAVLQVDQSTQYAEIVIAVTAVGVTPSVTFNIEAQDGAGAWYVLLTSAAIAAVGTTRLLLGPEILAAANVAVPCVLPDQIRCRPVHGNATTITYTVQLRAR